MSGIYARMLPNNFWQIIMYTIKINHQIHHQTDNVINAWASYRSLLRRGDLKDGEYIAVIESDGKVLDCQMIDTQSANSLKGVAVSYNQMLKQIMDSHQLTLDDLYIAIGQAKMTVSKSKAKGWLMPTDNRKHQKMHADELYLLLPYLPSPTCDCVGYTPNNLKALTQMTNLSIAAFCRQFDLPQATYFANIADVNAAGHRAMSYKSWRTLQKKVVDFLLTTAQNG